MADRPVDPKLRMSLTQFEDFMMARFDKADADHTGWLSQEQICGAAASPRLNGFAFKDARGVRAVRGCGSYAARFRPGWANAR